MDYREFCIEPSATVKEAMKQLNLAQVIKKVLCVTEENYLIGTLTDGDLRRYLMNGGGLDDTIDAAVQRAPCTATTYQEAFKILQTGIHVSIPVVSADGILKDIVWNNKKLILPKLGLPVVIMAGGKGTRLDPYTRVLPKPLIPVGDFPIMEHIMEQFSKFGCDDFHVIVNYKKQLLKAYFNENERSYQICWYDEERPLGTGGGLFLLKGHFHSTFFLTNCDVLLCSDYEAMLRFHKENGNAVTIMGAYKNLTIPYGVIEIRNDGVIEAMQEKPEFSFLTNTGVYLVEPEVLEDIQDNVAISFPDIIEMQRQKGRRVAVFPISAEEWLDMGQLEELEHMRKKLYGEQ